MDTTQSPWTSGEAAHRYPTLDEDLRVDVAIIGGGITGLMAAWFLEREGLEVAVLEARTLAGGETGATTAHLTVLRDTPYRTLASRFGTSGARLAAQGARSAVQWLDETRLLLDLDCDFQWHPAFVFAGDDTRSKRALELEADWLRRFGEEARVTRELPDAWRANGTALRVENQAQFHPLRFLRGVAARIHGGRGHLFEHSRVVDVEDGATCRVKTERATVTARHVFVCTDAPITPRVLMHPLLPPYRTYAVAAKVPEPLGFLGFDTEDPYHYVRTQPLPEGGHLLIVGGEDHRVGTERHTRECFVRLESWATERFGGLSFSHRWSGQVHEPVDGLPYVGLAPMAKNIFVATGFSGTGMTDGTLSARLLADEVLDNHQRVELRKLLAATRFKPLASARELITTATETPKRLLLDRLERGEVRALEEIPRGEGCLVRLEGKTVAAHHADDGTFNVVSAVCTHLGCHVHWNSAESSWDCPCHGSRFDTRGQVLHGPATRALEAVPIPTVPRARDEESTPERPASETLR